MTWNGSISSAPRLFCRHSLRQTSWLLPQVLHPSDPATSLNCLGTHEKNKVTFVGSPQNYLASPGCPEVRILQIRISGWISPQIVIVPVPSLLLNQVVGWNMVHLYIISILEEWQEPWLTFQWILVGSISPTISGEPRKKNGPLLSMKSWVV